MTSTLLTVLAYKFFSLCFAHESECEPEISEAVPFAIFSVIYVASAIRGTRVKSACEDAKATHQELQPASR